MRLLLGGAGKPARLGGQDRAADQQHGDACLDATARTLLAEGRAAFHAYGHATNRIFPWGAETILFPWRGDRIMNTLTVVLARHGLDVGQDGLAITVGNCSPAQLLGLITHLAATPEPDPLTLAATVRAKVHDKYDRYLSEDLLNLTYAARALDVPGAWSTLADLAGSLGDSHRP